MSKEIHKKLADSMPALSHLECSTCHRKQDIGNVADKLRGGWPKCHDYTMMLMTQKQVDEEKTDNE